MTTLAMAGLGPITTHELVARHGLTEEELSKKVNNKLFAHIIKNMNNWRNIRPYLGLNPADQEDIEGKSDAPQQRLFMLERWKEKYGREATFFQLVEVLLSAGRTDLAEEVCEFFEQNECKHKVVETEVFVTPAMSLGSEDTGSISEVTPLIPRQHAQPVALRESRQTIRKLNRVKCCQLCMNICGLLFFNFLIFIILLSSIALIVLSSTIYSPTIPPPKTIPIVKDIVTEVLLGKYNPFEIGNVTCTAIDAEAWFYKVQCQNLTTQNQTLEKSEVIQVSQRISTHPISELYLVEGSKLKLLFNLTSNFNTASQECIIEIFVFDQYTPYNNFLKYGTIPKEHTDKWCVDLHNKLTFNYQLTDNQTSSRYYLVGLYIPDTSVLETVHIKVTGYQLLYNVNHNMPDAQIQPGEKYEAKFKEKHYRASRNDICILGSTPTDINATKASCEAGGSSVVGHGHSALMAMGIEGLIISIPSLAFMVLTLFQALSKIKQKLNIESAYV